MPRGRPSLINDAASSSRALSTRRSARNAGNEPEFACGLQRASRRSRSSLAFCMDGVEEDEDELAHEFRDLNTQPSTQSKGKGKAVSRDSISSISTANEGTTSSGYSTPGTSAFATPAPNIKKEVITSRRLEMSTYPTMYEKPIFASAPIMRGRRPRGGRIGLNSSTPKRKRAFDEDDEDEDDTADAQLARALQAEEDAAAASMDMDETDIPGPSDQPFRELRPKPGRISGKRVSSKKAKVEVFDSDEDNTLSESEVQSVFEEDSEDDEIPLSTIRHRSMAIEKPVNKPPAITSVKDRRTQMDAVVISLKREETNASTSTTAPFIRDSTEMSTLTTQSSNFSSSLSLGDQDSDGDNSDDDPAALVGGPGTGLPYHARLAAARRRMAEKKGQSRAERDRARLEEQHPNLLTMWEDLKNLPVIKAVKAEQPTRINRELKPFQLEGLSWMQEMEKTDWGGGLLGDEMGMGKTIQAVSLIMSDYPAKEPSLVLIPPVALMQWQQEIGEYTDGTLKTLVFHGTNAKTKHITMAEIKKYDVILMSYNSLESMYRRQEKGFTRKGKIDKEMSVIHKVKFHRVILDEAHNIKQRTTGVAKACFALQASHKWCLSGTPLQNRIGEFFSLLRFLNVRPFASYFCKQCPCDHPEWNMNANNRCNMCGHSGMQHVSVFNQELLNPIVKNGNKGPGKIAFEKLRLLTDRFMLRRVKRDHSSAMELPAKEIFVDRHFFGEEENDFAGSIMNNGTRKFETYVAQGVLLNNYANIFGLIMQMRQVADHPDLILKKNGEGGQNILICCICDEAAEEAIRSACKHDFCRSCVKNYIKSSDENDIQPDCPRCHIPLAIDLDQPDIEQDEQMVKKSSIINRIKMENWTSSSKIEALVHDLHALRSPNSSTKSIIFSQFTSMLQLVEWRLRRAGITTVMLDGSMTPAQRQSSINHFMTNSDCECFLVSLKAGGVALNLTEASHVFIVDPWWNPAAEWQSADRCHRIGQSRPCTITRLCIEDSVESRMVLLQEKKANMINSTINGDQSAMESLTPEDMQFLFRGN